MNIFISYSGPDTELVKRIEEGFADLATISYWAKSKEPGTHDWPQIHKWIDQADLVLVVVTDKTISRAMAVGNEIGIAQKANKTIVPLVAPNVPKSELGCLHGITAIEFSPDDIQSAIKQLRPWVAKRKQNEDRIKAALWVAGGIGVLYLLSKNEKT